MLLTSVPLISGACPFLIIIIIHKLLLTIRLSSLAKCVEGSRMVVGRMVVGIPLVVLGLVAASLARSVEDSKLQV